MSTLFDYLTEIFDKDHNKDFYQEQVLLNEYSKCRSLDQMISELTRLYQHYIKWKCFSEKQNKNWIITIFDATTSIAYGYNKYSLGNSKTINENVLISTYKKAERLAIRDANCESMGYNIDSKTTYDLYKSEPRLLNIELLANPHFIYYLLSQSLNTNIYNSEWLEKNLY